MVMDVSLWLNDKRVRVEKGTFVLNAAKSNGISIPTLCYYKYVLPYGACRVCLVEAQIEGKTKITTSCNLPCLEGMRIRTDTSEVISVRKKVVGLLLSMAPEAPVIQNLAKYYGVEKRKTTSANLFGGLENCILCGLCTRVCEEVVGACAIVMSGRGSRRRVAVPMGDEIASTCIGCGACNAVCPTDAISMEHLKIEQLKQNLPGQRPCRYNLMGLMTGSVCSNNYECAACEIDQRFMDLCHPHHPIFLAKKRMALKVPGKK